MIVDETTARSQLIGARAEAAGGSRVAVARLYLLAYGLGLAERLVTALEGYLKAKARGV
jgi:hypothetical protein